MRLILLFFFLLRSMCNYAQQPATPAIKIQEALVQKTSMTESSLVRHLPFENIGPTIMSGRVVDLAVNPNKPTEFYVAYASGGLWYTNNNGTTFTPVMDSAPTINIGAIAVVWDKETIWVGTGESNASRSSYAGVGMLKSMDRGKTWQSAGLPDSHHIAKILVNPNNPKEVVVAATGHLYSPNGERGVYKTIDGGDSWQQTLFINDTTGAIDLAQVPNDFGVMYASMWQKDRKAWNFEGNGAASGIYKSEDAGSTWNKVSTKTSGFPSGSGVGRIGLAVFDKNTVYAIHDSQFRRKKKKEEKTRGLKKEDFKTMSPQTFLGLKNKKLDAFLKKNDFQEKYRAQNVKQLIRSEVVRPIDLAKYLENSTNDLFDTPVVGAEVFRSDDGGKTWSRTHPDYLDAIFYSYGYYFGQIRVHPVDPDHIYIMGVPILTSRNGGVSFESINAKNVHSDHHALWINPRNPKHLINGNDGGVNISYDSGKNWIKANQPAVGQFYAINVDNQTPYNIYGGLQDNGVWMAKNTAKESPEWHQKGAYPWKNIMGGDGMQIQIDSRLPHTIYTGYQFGNYARIHPITKKQTEIQPKHDLGTEAYRFNWQTPILLSPHHQDILYFGANKLLRSMNRGDEWTAISGDLTQGPKKGNVAYGTLTAIDESPLKFGLLYTGSDDGLLHLSRDGGENWKLLSETFPKDLWVSRVVASRHKVSRVYVTLNGYRWDNFLPYVFKSEDYGATWESLNMTLPLGAINVIREDPKNEDILYLGTDNGAYVSLDRGGAWLPFAKGLPNVAVHDIAIQPRDGHLLLGTHGRSIYKTSIKALQELTPGIVAKQLHLFDIPSMHWSENWGDSWSIWNPPSNSRLRFSYYAKTLQKGSVRVATKKGVVLKDFDIQLFQGLNEASYDLTITEAAKRQLEKLDDELDLIKKNDGNYYIPVGKYVLTIDTAKISVKTDFEVK